MVSVRAGPAGGVAGTGAGAVATGGNNRAGKGRLGGLVEAVATVVDCCRPPDMRDTRMDQCLPRPQ